MGRRGNGVIRGFAVLVIAAGFAGGCATKRLAMVEEVDESRGLPKDVFERFAVQEVAPPAAPAAAPSAPAMTGPSAPTGPVAAAPAKPAPPAVKPTKKGFRYPNRRPPADPPWHGERLVYEITYFGMVAGDFTLEVLPSKSVNGRKVYHVRGRAVSSSIFSLFYRLDDMVETFIDYDGLFSHRFHMLLDESKQTRDSLELFDSEKRETFFWNRWNHHKKGFVEQKVTQPIVPLPQDSLSALYYIRTVPLPDGSVVKFPIVSETKTWEAEVTVVRREEMKTPVGRVRTVVLKPETKYQGVLKKKGDSFVWVTDDDRRYVVQLEAKVRIGTIKAVLKEVHPGSALEPAAAGGT